MIVALFAAAYADDGDTIRADSVTVTVGEGTVQGCGGEVLETLEYDG